MTLEEFDRAMINVCSRLSAFKRKFHEAQQAEEAVYKEAGLETHPREPGFPCWTHKTLQGYYNTPREALENYWKIQKALKVVYDNIARDTQTDLPKEHV